MPFEKYLLFSLHDEKSKKLGEAISNPTCKKIIVLLAEKELSEEDISKELKLPINTIEYNLKKLLHAGLIEKSKNFFWSKKGKKIPTYKVANKLIVISPKNSTNVLSKIKDVLPVAIFSGILTLLISIFSKVQNSPEVLFKESDQILQAGVEAIPPANTLYNSGNWVWFLIGWASFVIVYLFWRSLRKPIFHKN